MHQEFGDVEVLKDFSMHVDDKEILCIIGPSGCGKSTVLNIISGHIEPVGGEVNNDSNISYVFQEDRLLPWATVYDNIALVNKNNNDILKLTKIVGLGGFESHYPEELSGGMRQRCAIARAFNYEADLLLMDEPFKSLDYNLRFSMIDQLLNLWTIKKNSIIFVTHEIDEALLLGDRIIVLSNRPTKVIREFKIKIDKLERSLSNKMLSDIRKKIIELLL